MELADSFSFCALLFRALVARLDAERLAVELDGGVTASE